MARMHGEHKQDYSARMAAESGKKEANEQFAKNSRPDSKLIPVQCPCSAKPYPHRHSLFERTKFVKIWNQQSKHRLRLPIDDAIYWSDSSVTEKGE